MQQSYFRYSYPKSIYLQESHFRWRHPCLNQENKTPTTKYYITISKTSMRENVFVDKTTIQEE
jgi:hypothetical protein